MIASGPASPITPVATGHREGGWPRDHAAGSEGHHCTAHEDTAHGLLPANRLAMPPPAPMLARSASKIGLTTSACNGHLGNAAQGRLDKIAERILGTLGGGRDVHQCSGDSLPNSGRCSRRAAMKILDVGEMRARSAGSSGWVLQRVVELPRPLPPEPDRSPSCMMLMSCICVFFGRSFRLDELVDILAHLFRDRHLAAREELVASIACLVQRLGQRRRPASQ